MAEETREWTTIPFQFGARIPVNLPRNVSMKEVEVNFVGIATDGAGFIANTAVTGIQVRYRGRLAFDRDADIIREMVEAQDGFAPVGDFWHVRPEGGLRGSEANVIEIITEAVAATVGGVGATIAGTTGNIVIRFKPTGATGKRMVDSRFFMNFAGAVGVQDFTIPMMDGRLFYIAVRSTDNAVLVDEVTDRIEVLNVTKGTTMKAGTVGQLIAEAQGRYKYQHNAGFIIIPINAAVTIREQLVLRITKVTAGAVDGIYSGIAIAQVK